MARSSSPFSSPFSRGEEYENGKLRRAKREFFRSTSEFSNDIDPMTSKPEQAPNLRIEVVSNPDVILDYEVGRVRWYLNEYSRYKTLGYDSVIRFPKGIDPENFDGSDNEIRSAIQSEFSENKTDYEAYANRFQETWDEMSRAMLSVMARTYGFPPAGHFKIVPTAYGTGGGSLEKGGVVFFRLPKFRPRVEGVDQPITEVEAITHEILCHEVTAHLRDGTAIDESSMLATHQEHKERLMDLLGRTLLVRAGIMKREEVRMVGGGDAAADDIDTIYYVNPTNPDENNLRFEGDLPGLVGAIEEKLKGT